MRTTIRIGTGAVGFGACRSELFDSGPVMALRLDQQDETDC